jgi:hypothetical protein
LRVHAFDRRAGLTGPLAARQARSRQ